jgi:hypothetical protein
VSVVEALGRRAFMRKFLDKDMCFINSLPREAGGVDWNRPSTNNNQTALLDSRRIAYQ